MAAIDDDLSYAAIGCAMKAHRELGPGLDERFYHELMARLLTIAGITHEVKLRGQLLHRGIVADEFEADLIVAGRLTVELKVLWGGFVPEHLMQLICYLKFWQLDVGLLLDFGKESLVQKRVPRLDHPVGFAPAEFERSWSAGPGTETVLEQITEALRVVLIQYGLGYRDTTYRGLLFAELTHRKIPCVRNPVAAVRSGGNCLGESKLPCLLLPGEGALLVTALRESRRAADRAVLQTYVRHLDVPWGLHINFGKTALHCQWVRNVPRHHGERGVSQGFKTFTDWSG